ncbi:MAG: tetratricopeptide repeat protein [Candidatus Methylacidiphilales bacterium]
MTGLTYFRFPLYPRAVMAVMVMLSLVATATLPTTAYAQAQPVRRPEAVARAKEIAEKFKEAFNRFDSKDYKGTIQLCDELIAFRPDPYLYYLRALSFLELGKYEAARNDAEQALRAFPSSPLGYLISAVCYLHDRMYEKAWEALSKADSLYTSTKNKTARLSRILAFALFCKGGDDNRVAELAEEARATAKDSKDYLKSTYLLWSARARQGKGGDITGTIREAVDKEKQRLVEEAVGKGLDPDLSGDTPWNVSIGRFLLGDLTEGELLKLAAESEDAKVRASQMCEACFYIAMCFIGEGEPAKAIPFLVRSVSTKSPTETLDMAISQLQKLDPKNAALDLVGGR